MRRLAWLLLLLLGAAAAAPLPGRLTDAAGQPVPGAAVWACPESSALQRAVAPATTGADGGFTLDLPAALDHSRRMSVLARVPGRGCVAERVTLPSARLELRLRPGTSLDGIVLDAQRRPVSGAVVVPHVFGLGDGYCQVPRACAAALWPCRTDAEGRWRLDDLPTAARRDFLVAAPGLATASVGVGAGFQPSPGCYATLAPGGAIRGRVVDANGHGAAGQHVVSGWGEAVTDADGRYMLESLGVGRWTVKLAEQADATWVAEPIAGVAVTAGATAEVPDLKLVSPAVVRGRVLGDRPDWANLTRTGGGDQGVDIDPRGGFSVTVPPGEYRLDLVGAERRVTVKAGQTVDLGEVRLPDKPQVQVRVLDDQGQPLRDAEVWACSGGSVLRPLRTNGQGFYTPPYSPTDGDIVVVAPGPWQTAKGKLVDGRAEVTLAGLATAPLSGRVLDTAGRAVVGATVGLRPGDAGPGALRAATDAAGRFRFERVPADWRGELRAAHPECRPSRALALSRLGEPVSHDLVVERLAERVSGRVVDAAGRPVAAAMVLAEGYADGPPALSGPDGAFVRDRLPAGPVTLVALSGRRAVGRAKVTPPAQGVMLTVADASPLDWSGAPSEDDRDLALDLARLALDGAEPDEHSLAHMARIDPAEALDRLLELPADRRRGLLPAMLALMPPQVRLGDEVIPLVKAAPGPLRAVLACLAVAHVPAERTEVRAQLLALATAAHNPTATDTMAVVTGLCVLDVAEQTGSPTFDALLPGVLGLIGRDPQAMQVVAELPEEIDLPPRLTDALLGVVQSPQGKALLQLNRIRGLIVSDPPAALALARRWWPGPDGGVAPPAVLDERFLRLGRFVAELAAGLVNTQPAEAQTLLRAVKDDLPAFDGLLYAAWSARDPALARQLVVDAERRLPADKHENGALLALTGALDADTAERALELLLSQAVFAANQPTDPLGEPPSWQRDHRAAYALALTDPNRARWAAESLWAGGPSERSRAWLLIPMAMVDLPRAVAMAKSDECAAADRLALVRWLLADRRDRCALGLDEWTVNASVWPGHGLRR